MLHQGTTQADLPLIQDEGLLRCDGQRRVKADMQAMCRWLVVSLQGEQQVESLS